jgi:hypothetical protein
MYPNPVVQTRPPDFARGASLTAAVAVAVLTLLLAPANAVPGVEQPAAGASLEFNKEDGTLYIDWSGPIVARMADDMRAALDKYGTVLDRVVLCVPKTLSVLIARPNRLNVSGDDCAALLLAHSVCLAVQVEEPT